MRALAGRTLSRADATVTGISGRLRWLAFGISPAEVTFARRGFASTSPETRLRLEEIGRTFLQGYRAALDEGSPESLGRRLDSIATEVRGFAFEGSAMALALLDEITPWRRDRIGRLLDGPGGPHAYMVHVGAGWALARLGRAVEGPTARLDPLLGWLAVDGYGFHEGYFRWPRYVAARESPRRVVGYARRVFDQGLGRSLWFVGGADVARISTTIERFPSARRADLWSGVGLASSYAGELDEAGLAGLRAAAGAAWPALAQGAAFAAAARVRAANATSYTERASRVLCGMSAAEAAGLTDSALQGLPCSGRVPSYEIWRQRIQAHLGGEAISC
jgi:hypothetical protein